MTRAAPVRASRRVVLVVVAGASLVLAGCSSSDAPGQPTSASSLTAQLPNGWRTQVYGKAALSVPANWTVALDAACPPNAASGTLYLGRPPNPTFSCPATHVSHATVTVTSLGMPGLGNPPGTAGCSPQTVNQLRVFVGPCDRSGNPGGTTTWTIPALGVQVVATTSDLTYTGVRTDSVVGRELHTIRRASPTEVATRSPLNLRLTLAHTTVKAGTSIKGSVSFTNTTTEDITVDMCAAAGWLDVGLTGHGIVFAPAHILIACQPTVQLRPGTTQVPVTASTSYLRCTPPGASVSAAEVLPTCLPTGPPPLPVGTYRTAVVTAGLPADASGPNVLAVTLTR